MSVEKFREAVNKGDILAAILAVQTIPDINISYELLDRGTPLCYVTDNCTSSILVQTLLDSGANVNIPDWTMWTPLHYATKWGEVETTQILLDVGANVHACTNDMWTPLHAASYSSCLEIAGLLLNKGVDINAKTTSGLIPLHFLIRFSSLPEVDTIQEFINAGANLDLQDKAGYTPLMMAAEQGHPDVCDILIKGGANISLKNKNGQTAMDIAVHEIGSHIGTNSNHANIARMLSRV